MRSIFAGMIMLSAATAVVLPAEAQNGTKTQPGYGYMQAPVGHRQPTQDDVKGADQVEIEMDNELNNLAAGDHVAGANQVQSEENALAQEIEHENELVDRAVRGICTGC
jgi:hypothetical protein